MNENQNQKGKPQWQAPKLHVAKVKPAVSTKASHPDENPTKRPAAS